MKRLGFTLAEVLITLGIIGVVSAVTLPTLMSNTQYKQIGVKLSKFQSTLENNALADVAANGSFYDSNDVVTRISDFINDSYMFKETYDASGKVTNTNTLSLISAYPSSDRQSHALKAPYGVLKDGTAISVYKFSNQNMGSFYSHFAGGTVDGEQKFINKYGQSAFRVLMAPNVRGLSSDAQNLFDFFVTEKGYVFPADSQDCLMEIYNNDWNVKSSWFKNKGVCTEESWT